MSVRLASMVAAMLWMMAGKPASAQSVGPVASDGRLLSLAASADVVVRTLSEATRADVRRGATAILYQPAATSHVRTHRALKWGVSIGAVAGIVAGALQPTHSNGEYVLGGSRLSSTLALGGIGAGVGALIGFAIDR